LPPRCRNAAGDLCSTNRSATALALDSIFRPGSARSKTIFCSVLYDASLLRRADVPNLGTIDPTRFGAARG
jgi:hypothetical protein